MFLWSHPAYCSAILQANYKKCYNQCKNLSIKPTNLGKLLRICMYHTAISVCTYCPNKSIRDGKHFVSFNSNSVYM